VGMIWTVEVNAAQWRVTARWTPISVRVYVTAAGLFVADQMADDSGELPHAKTRDELCERLSLLFYARDPGHPDFTHATIELSGGGDTIWRGTFNAGIRAQITLSGNGYFVSQVFDSAGSILWPMRGWRTLAHAKKHAKLVAQRTEEIQRAAVAQRLREDMSQTIVNATEEMISYDASS
jgi:hypothetical protein